MANISIKHIEDQITIYSAGSIIGNCFVIETPSTLEPHVEWHGASAREIYQATVMVIQHLQAVKNVLIITCTRYAAWFNALVKRGILRFVGYMENILRDGAVDNMYIYQAKQC